jgi:hypothetical protein
VINFKSQENEGIFTEVTYGKHFTYRPTEYRWATDRGLMHEIDVLDGVRYGNVKKTVAYVCIDEDEYGNAVMEKWNIKRI